MSGITVLPWLPARPVSTVSFDGVALSADVRIFGPGASPAQDLEPEYIRLSSDSATAYVMLQENNAIALHGAKIYAFDLTGATDITSKDSLYDVGGNVVKSLDQMSTPELALAVITDNDFGVAGIAIDPGTGTFAPRPSYMP